MRNLFSRTKATRLHWLIVALAITAGGTWWWADREARRPDGAVPAVSMPANPPAEPAAAEPPPSISERLNDALQPENAPTTEADPPHVKDGVSRGHALGLQNTHDPLHLKASAAFVIDPRDGAVLFHKNEDAVLPIASVTKLMTALVLMEAKLPMDEVITITEDDVDHERHSRSRLRVGTALTRREALHLALMSSENRAAHALGRTFPGGLGTFVDLMNRKARALGMKSTTYADPTGLSARNQSTARDLAAVVLAASKEPLIREFSTTVEHDAMLGKRKVRFNNSDRLVKSSRWNIHLQKTGYIVEAGQCLVVNATVGPDRELILVLLDSADKRSRIDDAERIRKWATGEPPRASLREKVRKLKRRLTGEAAKHK
ncbi:MAG TPA: serine hydrolase [Ramlibacter sp.]|jgi:D-alanyl-D-alanine endopeptidase (penicillin-binding protein 7)|nr:serine hydrolase [Ramlibacter sp.]